MVSELRWNHTMLDFLNDSMHTIIRALIYARIHCIERCMLHIHDFYIYYGLLHSLCMHQSKEIIANFIVIYQTSDCMHQSKHSSMHACMHAWMLIIQEIEHRVIPSLNIILYIMPPIFLSNLWKLSVSL